MNERAENVLCHIFIILLAIQRAGLTGQKKTFGKEEVEDEDEEKERTESGASPRPRKVRPSISASEEKDPLKPSGYRVKQSSLLTLAKYWMATANIRL